MPKYTWVFASIIAAGFVLVAAAFKVRQNGEQIRDLERQLSEAREWIEGAGQTNATLAAEILSTRERAQALEQELQAATSAQRDLEQQMRSELESKDVTISELRGKLTVDIMDRILFDSGEAIIKPEGEQVLAKLGRVLSQYPQRRIHVIGHTDNVPIRTATRGGFTSNWELSAGRATAAVRFLQDQAGVDPRRLAAVAHGEFHPIADNGSPEGRARNRRIAVVVLPEDIAPTDLPRKTSGNTPSTNAPAAKPSEAPTRPVPSP